MPIRLLPDEVASQIAAGEVVERPASVVKELVENALDAGASQISILIQQAGRQLIEIADDGSGIPADELGLAVTRHATSKLRSAEDLFHIRTLGFRGEAMASIGSVSRMTVTTQQKESPTGARMLVEAGHAGELTRVGAPQGTLVRVENLFYNVPARLKFLKQDSTERQQIDALVGRYAIAYPQVRFKLVQEGKTSLQTTGSGDQREVLTQIYGLDVARQMLEVLLEEDDIRVRGFISPVALTRSNRKEITFFVNGRWVQDPALSAALLQAYHTLLMIGRYPMAVLFLELDPEMVDVNVHPAKAEVRFRAQDRIFGAVTRAARRAILAYSPVPHISPAGWRTEPGPRWIDPAWNMAADASLQPGLNLASQAASSGPDEQQADDSPQELPSGQIPLLRLIGQIGSTYLVAEGPDGLYLIDQHAAHERVLFEKLMQLHGKTTIPAQRLLNPHVIQLPAQQAALLHDQLDALIHLGFEVEEFGPNTFRVRSLPVILAGGDPASAVRVLVEDFEEDETPLQNEVEARIAARVCKRMAVKGGQTLSPEEQRELLQSLEACNSPRTCPHGRPTMIHLSVDLLERQFGRRGSR